MTLFEGDQPAWKCWNKQKQRLTKEANRNLRRSVT